MTEAASPASRTLLTTRKRVLTRRGVLWLGQTCNLRCYFCYFVHRIGDREHPEHAFMELDKAKAICRVLRDFYGNTAVDIQGGEPTIHPDILSLVQFCRETGLYPTLITNALRLAHPGELERHQDAGIRDFLISLHGVGGVHDSVVGREGAYQDVLRAIDGMCRLAIPFRFNCTMSEPVIPLLPEIARIAIDRGAGVVNYIAFNPFGDQTAGVRTARNVPRYGVIRGPLAEALDILEAAGIEANVRYLPLCFAEPRHRKSFYNYQQLPYDTHEWDYQSWLWSMMQPQMMREGGLVPPFRIGARGGRLYRECSAHALRDLCGAQPLAGPVKFGLQRVLGRIEELARGKEALYRDEARARAARDCGYRYHAACGQCALKGVCDGFHGDYADLFGTDEAQPVTGMPPIDDPRHFIRDQVKVIEEEDKTWAL